MNNPKTTQQAFENANKVFRNLGKALRKVFFCSRGTHWHMKYDSGFKHDFLGAGTCDDCGHRQESRIPTAMPRVKSAKKTVVMHTKCNQCGYSGLATSFPIHDCRPENKWVSTLHRQPDISECIEFKFYGMGDWHEAVGIYDGNWTRDDGYVIPNSQVRYWRYS